jgi:aerobic carbon-monoxide dehydrogenase small subunit
MTAVGITVNGRAVNAPVEPRTHLADFLRDTVNLTGTHLGCEHGVCGACTLLLDDMPVRSCITYAVACEGSRVVTIEGLDDDEIATELRAAFTREHALQCGYCTPGMLIAARDLVLRLESADERSIRLGLSGNLCRCTGYVGIVRAVRAVIAQRRKRGILPIVGAGRALLGPVGSHSGIGTDVQARARPAPSAEAEHPEHVADRRAADIPNFLPNNIFHDRFTVAAPPDEVFALFGNLRQVAACFPGAALTDVPAPDRVEGVIRVKLGPVTVDFHGAARIERDLDNSAGRITGIGRDQRSRSSTQGQISYRLVPIEQGAATRVELSIGYSLQGMLAQIAREGLVRDLARRLTAEFARNLDRHLAGATRNEPAQQGGSLDGFTLLFSLFRSRVRNIIRKVWDRQQDRAARHHKSKPSDD